MKLLLSLVFVTQSCLVVNIGKDRLQWPIAQCDRDKTWLLTGVPGPCHVSQLHFFNQGLWRLQSIIHVDILCESTHKGWPSTPTLTETWFHQSWVPGHLSLSEQADTETLGLCSYVLHRKRQESTCASFVHIWGVSWLNYQTASQGACIVIEGLPSMLTGLGSIPSKS